MTEPIHEPTHADAVHTITRAALSAAPIVGGPLVELFQSVFAPPLEKRRVAWMLSIGERLDQLEASGLKVAELSKNEAFVSAAMQAAHIAMRTHNADKLAALQNAVVNIAIDQSFSENMQAMILNMIDALTPLHLRVLKHLQDPPQPNDVERDTIGSIILSAMPDLRGQEELIRQAARHLYTQGLTDTDRFRTEMSGNGLEGKRTTELGDAFLNFISQRAAP